MRAEQPGSSGTRSATPRRPAGRRHLVALCVVAVLLNGVGLTGRSTASSAGPLRLVALGDSVPAGTACHCANFVALLGDRIAAALHRRVLVINDARPGEDSTGLRADLDGGSAIGDDVANTDVVVVNIGANDVSFNDYSDAGCAAEHTACYTTVFSMLRANLTAVVHRISALRHGQDTQVVVVGYWNIWQDGSVGEAKGPEFQQVSRDLTSAVNRTLQQVALAGGLSYVDLVTPFHGADGASDVDAMLADDGDHPNAAGHRVIAAAILRQLPELLTRR